MIKDVETKTIKQICEEYGCTLDEWKQTVDMLCSKGIANGCFQDYGLLLIVIEKLVSHS